MNNKIIESEWWSVENKTVVLTDKAPLWLRKEMKKKVRCLCCGYRTLDERGGYDICPVCFWEDDCYLVFYSEDGKDKMTTIFSHNNCDDDDYNGDDIIDIPSGANHSLTLRQGRENYKSFGACERDMIEHCRKPKKSEMI